ncbi:unnamed protein product [Orchesella dallaii]|uniref:UBC core domain-containing protein n=1 Tax=Orchesella dallaii TaxID=48710 RepID=A0ABP1QPD6_9HEXA
MASNRLDFSTRKRSSFDMTSNFNEEDGEELDQESVIGGPIDSRNNNSNRNDDENEVDGINSSKISQPLLRGDRVLSVGNYGGWSMLRRRRKDAKTVVGSVTLGKEQTLSILWEHGKVEKLSTKSDLLSYGDRVFVLDRECISVGSSVAVTGHPDRFVGKVLSKRYIVSGSCMKNPEVILDNIDTKSLSRHYSGGAYMGIKILFEGWIGITIGCRARIFLKIVEDGTEFSIVDDGRLQQSFFVGEEVKLGLSLLWKAEEIGGRDSLWLANFVKYFNTSAIITNIEIEELDCCWIGKASSPNADYNPFDFPDAPDKIITYENLQDVQYLVGENCHHITRKSLWKYVSTAHDVPISREKWIGKWLKIVDWDRWEYPAAEEVKDKENYLNKELVLQIQYVRSVIDVLWANGTRSTVSTSDVIPAHVGSVWSEITKLHSGAVVRDRLDFESKDKYGILLSVDEPMKATVRWITPHAKDDGAGGFTETTSSNVPLYNLVENDEYDFLSRVSDCPLVHSENNIQIGVVTGVKFSTGEVEVKLPSGKLERRLPHELTHYKCDVLYCPKEKRWVSWYDHVIPPSGIVIVGPSAEPDAKEEVCKFDESLSVPIVPRKRLDFTEDVPSDNIFIGEDMIPRVRETQFRRAVEKEVAEMSTEGKFGLPEGIWVEYYLNRGDILSAVVAGPQDTLYEDFLFVFDIFLLEDFPRSEPHINFRSMGVTLFPRHFCKSGAVFLPEATRLTEKDFTFSYIQNLLLEVQDFMMMPLEQIRKIDKEETGIIQYESVDELHKFLLLSVLDYTIAILRNPPKHWNSLISQHFSEALPRIIERYSKGSIQLKRATASVSNEKGDVPKMEEIEVVTIPWNNIYRKCIDARVHVLQDIHESWKGIGVK